MSDGGYASADDAVNSDKSDVLADEDSSFFSTGNTIGWTLFFAFFL